MKTLLFTFLFSLAVILPIHAQKQPIEGVYTNTWKSSEDAALTYTLTLHDDGTFHFEKTRTFASSHPATTETAQGTWKRKHHLVTLITNSSAEEALVKNLNNTKARFKALSPRHRKFNEVKPRLNFYKSKVFHAKGMKLVKKEDAVSALKS